MRLAIPIRGAVWTLIVVALSAALFVYLMGRFGGPSVSVGGPAYRVAMTVPDAQGLANKSDVLVRGVKVGEIATIRRTGSAARIEITIRDRYAPIPRTATARVGQKTLLGEAYLDLDLDRPGAPLRTGGELPRSQVRESVELDEALAAFGEGAQRDIQAMTATFARGARSPRTSARVSATLGRLDALTAELRGLGDLLDGQQRTVAGVVLDGRKAFEALGTHDAQISRLVSAGRATLAATAAAQTGLSEGLRELPLLLDSADRALRTAQPLVGEARPLVADLRRLGPSLAPALDDLRPVARSARAVVAGLPALRAAATPTLRAARPALAAAGPLLDRLEPALANLVPIVGYLSQRRRTVSAWFANTAGIGARGDAKGSYVRFNIFVEPGTGFGGPGAFSSNAYTEPGDAADNQPYRAGAYPRLQPFRP